MLQLRELVAVVERPHVESELIEEMLDRDVPIVRGDARSAKTLEAAGMRRAKAVILATQDDLTNLDAALTARDLNPGARVVMRMFDESLAEKVGGSFALPAVSTARVAAPAFVAAATGRKVYQDFQLAGRHVPRADALLPIGIVAAACDPCHVDRACAETANARHAAGQALHLRIKLFVAVLGRERDADP